MRELNIFHMFHYIESITVYISFPYIQSIIVIARVTIARVPLCINASRALKLRGRGIPRGVRGAAFLFFLPVERKKESEKDLSKKIKTKPVRRAPLVEQESECGKEEKGFTSIIAFSVRTRKCVSAWSLIDENYPLCAFSLCRGHVDFYLMKSDCRTNDSLSRKRLSVANCLYLSYYIKYYFSLLSSISPTLYLCIYLLTQESLIDIFFVTNN